MMRSWWFAWRTALRPVLLIVLLALSSAKSGCAAEYRPLPPPAPTGLTTEWLLHDANRNRLVLFLPDYHTPAHAYYQYVYTQQNQPFPISFAAQPGLSLFLDNELLFTARKASSYSLDLSRLLPSSLANGRHLLAVWQPNGFPALSSFQTIARPVPSQAAASPGVQPRLPRSQGQNIFLGSLLLIGLLYGSIRRTYQSGMARIFQFGELFGNSADEQGFLAKPAFTLLNLALILLFALSFALLLTAIHTDLQNLPLLRQFFHVPETAIAARVLLYTAIIAAFVLGKYLFLESLGYIFDVQALVNVQYREFLRTTLWASLALPLVLLLYLSVGGSMPRTVTAVASGAIGLLLIGTLLRVGRALHRRASLLNLHLFAYLCATEVLPLLILLRVVVFPY